MWKYTDERKITKIEMPIIFKIDKREINKGEINIAKKLTDVYDSAILLWLINVFDQEGYNFRKTIDGKKIIMSKDNRIVSEFSYEIGGPEK
jgi:hypothetical protein